MPCDPQDPPIVTADGEGFPFIVTRRVGFFDVGSRQMRTVFPWQFGGAGLVQIRVTYPSIGTVVMSFSELSVSPKLVEFDRHPFHGGNRHVLSYSRHRGFAAGNS
jgi:hypothetical protein